MLSLSLGHVGLPYFTDCSVSCVWFGNLTPRSSCPQSCQGIERLQHPRHHLNPERDFGSVFLVLRLLRKSPRIHKNEMSHMFRVTYGVGRGQKSTKTVSQQNESIQLHLLPPFLYAFYKLCLGQHRIVTEFGTTASPETEHIKSVQRPLLG